MDKNNQVMTKHITKRLVDHWDMAINDAQNELVVVARKKARLEQAIRIFRANKQEGIPWPGTRNAEDVEQPQIVRQSQARPKT